MKIDTPKGKFGLVFHHHIPRPGTEYREGVPRGMTVCWLRTGEGHTISSGVAYLHPKDNYCKETGRKIALAQALRRTTREDRRHVWQAYFTARGKTQYLPKEARVDRAAAV